MLTIRLSRTGKKKAPQYRIVLQEKQHDPWAPAIEILGHHNPRAKENKTVLKVERIKYWLEKGAQPSITVHNMLIDAKIIEGEKKSAVKISKKRAAKIAEKEAERKAKEEEAKAKAAEEQAAKEAEAKANDKKTNETAENTETETDNKEEITDKPENE
ncbi:30S ribosomal protein S16 [Candidatus Parcubacteria bacterium]|nr:MAG: 30S ribosomal protein S16 [Candidatus Parcubacteria bacterium]